MQHKQSGTHNSGHATPSSEASDSKRRPSARAVALKQLQQHNESSRGTGVRKLRRLVSSVVRSSNFNTEGGRLLSAALESGQPESSVKIAREMLSQSYDSSREHFISSQLALLVKKYPFPASEDVARANGLKKFLTGERRNRHMNRVLKQREESGASLESKTLHHVRDYVQRVLGPEIDWKEVAKHCRFGPGASVGVNGRFTNFARKFLSEKWTITFEALPIFAFCARQCPEFWDLLGLTKTLNLGTDEDPSGYQVICVDIEQFNSRLFKRLTIVDYNKIAFAKKDADCDRTIASEPLCNGWVQLGLDEYMKLRLRRFGIDLRQQERNQRMAREGSLEGVCNPYVTIDLKNASGSICTEIVRSALLYVPKWFESLDVLRSKKYRLPDTETAVEYHGFVSMGNGFCFPLETVLFAAACYASQKYTGSPEDFTVYGDDIIIRQNEALVLIEILRSMGFSINRDKTFCFGPFRESCGTDWYQGLDVRPIVLDTSLESIEERVRFHNALARLPNEYAPVLANAALELMPPFMVKFVRPFAGHTDEAIDGRHMHCVRPPYKGDRNTSPTWLGVSFHPVRDKEIEDHADYHTALYYGCLSGSSSEVPFAERRETRMRVGRFSHSGSTSNWLPLPPPLMAVYNDSYGYSFHPSVALANLVVSRMAL